MRIITSSGRNVNSVPLCKSTFTLTLGDLNTFQFASCVYQAANNALPLSFNNYFISHKVIHDHFTIRKEIFIFCIVILMSEHFVLRIMFPKYGPLYKLI